MMERVRQRVAANPGDPVAWRMLGKLLLVRDDPGAAADALERAIELDSQRVAAHFDLGECRLALGQTELAIASFRRVMELAPDSEEADHARERLNAIAPANNPFRLVNFEPRWVETPVDDDDLLPDNFADSPWRWRLETGLLFNSNVDLAPISRQLSPLENGGFQATLAPEMEYTFIDQDHVAGGVELRSFYAFNQPDNDQFNLQHYQPGVFVEFPFLWGNCEIVPQLRYDFAYDIFAGSTLGTRHTLTPSVAAFAVDGSSWVAYFAADDTNFRNDGANPGEDSLDGPTYTLGVIRQWASVSPYILDPRLSVDGQWADLRGDNQAYYGGFALLSATCPWHDCWQWRPEAGIGFRTYPDFVGTPSRDEVIWRGGVELRRLLGDDCYLSTTCYYDRFSSSNDAYAAERFTAGTSLTLER